MKNKMLKRMLSVMGAAALSAGAVEIPNAAAVDGVILINEICTGNTGANGNLTGAVDKDNEYCDWIELYNPGSTDMDITGWVLVKDDKNEYTFEGVVVPAGGRQIVYCCKTYNGDESIPHAGFNLSGSGVKLTLKNGDTQSDTVDVPALNDDIVWGRKPDGGEFELLFPTPGVSNAESESAVPCNAPVMSKQGGMYAEAFDLTMSTDDGNKIYYTLDGSDPATSETRVEYTSPINIYNRSNDPYIVAELAKPRLVTPWDGYKLPQQSAVDKGTIVRAVTLSANGKYSETVTSSYFIGVSSADHNGLPILSVTMDTDDLFDYEKGIYVLGKVYDENKRTAPDPSNPPANYNQKGKEWERPCHIDFFEPDGTLAVSQDCGVRTKGAYSRADYQKSLRFYAREEYGEKNFKYTFFDDAFQENGSGKQLKKFKKLVVRNGGNDTNYTKFKDLYTGELVSDRAFDTQEGRPCVVYIDGEYWGLYTLQEEYDDHYFEENYDVNSDEVVVYKKGEIDEGNEEDIELFNTMRKYAERHDLSNEKYYAEMCKMIDVKSFADYMAAEIYIANEDWPGNNYSMWRTRTVDETNPYADGRWRMCFYDTEMGTDHYGNASTKPGYNKLKDILKNTWDDLPVLLNALLKNDSFKAMFVNSFMDITNINFEYTKARALLNEYKAAYYPEMKKYYARFPNWAGTWTTDECISRLNAFLKERPAYVPQMLQSNFGLSDAVDVTINAVNPSGGVVTLNGSKLDLAKDLSGKYFDEYKITLTAEPKEGYTFKGWAGSYTGTSRSITIKASQARSIQAVFEKSGDKIVKTTFTDGAKSIDTYTLSGTEPFVPVNCFVKTGYKVGAASSGKVYSDKNIKISYTPVSYKVKFDANRGKGTMTSQTFKYDTAQKLKGCTFTRDTYIFIGWGVKSFSQTPDYTDKASISNLTATDGDSITLYALWRKDIALKESTLSADSFVYTGKAIKPAVTVKNGTITLTEGKDYTVSYSDNVKCGNKACVTVKGMGNYGGTKKLYFKIAPKSTKITKSSRAKTSIKLTWSKAAGADKYLVYRKQGTQFKLIKTVTGTSFTDKGLTAGTLYKYRVYPSGAGIKGARAELTTCTKCKTVALKATSKTRKKAKLTWKKISGASGYQLYYSTKKNGSYKLIKNLSSKTTGYTKSKLTSGKKYYFKLRAYKTINGKKYYSDFSKIVSKKIK
ncbi:MAG: CotH kinase family protein [Ruminococcus sp.]|nr:CotH kinase family protein [Ruminococcus sp.]